MKTLALFYKSQNDLCYPFLVTNCYVQPNTVVCKYVSVQLHCLPSIRTFDNNEKTTRLILIFMNGSCNIIFVSVVTCKHYLRLWNIES